MNILTTKSYKAYLKHLSEIDRQMGIKNTTSYINKKGYVPVDRERPFFKKYYKFNPTLHEYKKRIFPVFFSSEMNVALVNKITELTEQEGISIRNFEEKLNLSNGSVRRWTSSMPSVDKIVEIAEYFNIPIESLLTLKNTTEYDLNAILSLSSKAFVQTEEGKHYLTGDEKKFLLDASQYYRKDKSFVFLFDDENKTARDIEIHHIDHTLVTAALSEGFYKVKSDEESLFLIAYKVKSSIEELMKLNSLTDETIHEGMILTVKDNIF